MQLPFTMVLPYMCQHQVCHMYVTYENQCICRYKTIMSVYCCCCWHWLCRQRFREGTSMAATDMLVTYKAYLGQRDLATATTGKGMVNGKCWKSIVLTPFPHYWSFNYSLPGRLLARLCAAANISHCQRSMQLTVRNIFSKYLSLFGDAPVTVASG